MRKEYESPKCKVVLIDKKDVLTLSTTKLFQSFNKGTEGDFDGNDYGGAYVGFGDLFG